MLVSDSNHWWKYWQWKLNVSDMRGIPDEQIRIQPGSKNPKGTDKTERQKRRKIQFSFFLLLKGWQRQCSNTDNKLCCSFPRAVVWLFGWSWNGQDQRDWKSTANNILNRLPLCDISAVAWGCVLQTFNVCVCTCVYTNRFVYVHYSGTSRILSMALKIFTRDKALRMGARASLT